MLVFHDLPRAGGEIGVRDQALALSLAFKAPEQDTLGLQRVIAPFHDHPKALCFQDPCCKLWLGLLNHPAGAEIKVFATKDRRLPFEGRFHANVAPGLCR